MQPWQLIVIIVAAFIFLVLFFSFVPVGLWIKTRASSVKLRIFSLIGMRLRKIPPNRIVTPLIKAVKAGVPMTTDMLEQHYLAGGMWTASSTR